ncbi:hypothetical protein [Pseudomonas sp. BN415]|uniref:hypothetical protein n=1 Tax=Pseudomonas sp. BN415 TaxID=2567889 RepID=UPI002456CA4A|nr:hypothetical protein [Pseudomonas sp. BN415]
MESTRRPLQQHDEIQQTATTVTEMTSAMEEVARVANTGHKLSRPALELQERVVRFGL